MIEIKYYKKYTGKSGSIVDALKAIGVKDTSKEARAKLATLNGIKSYRGTAPQNTALLTKLKSGKLIKSKTETFKNREKFIGCLQKYAPVLKKYGAQIHYSFTDSETTFAKAEDVLKNGKKTGLTCVVPCRWALKDTGISPSGFYGKTGSFADCYKGDVKKHLSRLVSGDVIGLTVKQAVDKKLLSPGDIIAFKDATHTFVWTGTGYLVYDGGHAAIKNGIYTGIIVDYSKKYASRRIGEVLRWKD